MAKWLQFFGGDIIACTECRKSKYRESCSRAPIDFRRLGVNVCICPSSSCDLPLNTSLSGYYVGYAGYAGGWSDIRPIPNSFGRKIWCSQIPNFPRITQHKAWFSHSCFGRSIVYTENCPWTCWMPPSRTCGELGMIIRGCSFWQPGSSQWIYEIQSILKATETLTHASFCIH